MEISEKNILSRKELIRENELEKDFEDKTKNIEALINGEEKLITDIDKSGEKEPRARRVFRRVIIGTTIMASLWVGGRVKDREVSAADSSTKIEREYIQEEKYSTIEEIDERYRELKKEEDRLLQEYRNLTKVRRDILLHKGNWDSYSEEEIGKILEDTYKQQDDMKYERWGVHNKIVQLILKKITKTLDNTSTVMKDMNLVEDILDYSNVSPKELKDLRMVADRFYNAKNAVDFDEKKEMEKIIKAGKLDDLIHVLDRALNAFTKLDSSQKRLLEKEGLSIDDLIEIKEIFEKYLPQE